MNLYDEIAKTAHELYVKSGCVSGRDLENWVEAERIVKARYGAEESPKKNPSVTTENIAGKKAAPVIAKEAPKKAEPVIAKEVAPPKKAAEPKKTPAKRAAKTKKTE